MTWSTRSAAIYISASSIRIRRTGKLVPLDPSMRLGLQSQIRFLTPPYSTRQAAFCILGSGSSRRNQARRSSFCVINPEIGSISQAEIPWSVRVQQLSVKKSKSAPIGRYTRSQYQVG
jgi:hypothetical protein